MRIEKKYVAPLGVLLLLICVLCAAFLVCQIFLGHGLQAMVPVSSDELNYWQTIRSVAAYGPGHIGNQGVDETTSAMGGFDAHGPIPTVVFGALFGLMHLREPYAFILFQMVLLTLAALFFAKACDLSGLWRWVFAASVFLSPITLLYTYSWMMEIYHMSLMLIYGGLFAICCRPGKRPLAKALLILFTFYLCINRITYVVLFLATAYGVSGRRMHGGYFLWLGVFVLAASMGFFAMGRFTGYYPNFYSGMMAFLARGDLRSTVYGLRDHLWQNLGLYFALDRDSAVEVLQRYFQFLALLGLLGGSFLSFSPAQGEGEGKKMRLSPKADPMFFLPFLLLLGSIALVTALYDIMVWRDFRLLYPVFFLVLLAMIGFGKKPAACALLCMQLIGFAAALGPAKTQALARFPVYDIHQAQEIARQIHYDGDAQNQWDNTIFFDDYKSPVLLEIPPGIGLNYAYYQPIQDAHKAKYLLVAQPLGEGLPEYQAILQNDYGTLYIRNP